MRWTKDRIEKLKELRAAGLTGEQIAREMKTTRNAIAGMLYRLRVVRPSHAARLGFDDIDVGDLRYVNVAEHEKARMALRSFSQRSGRRFVTAISGDGRLFVARYE